MSTLPTRFRRNALANYGNSFVTLALALLVTPILVRGLGKEAYGTWVLVTSLVLYFNLLKFGFSKAAIKYVAEGEATGDLDRIRRTVATSCAALSIPGLVLLLTAPGFAFLFPVLFHVSAHLRLASMILVALSVVDLAVAIPADTFGSALTGFQRFELLNATLTATAVAQAVAWTVILALGGGLIAIGVAGVSLSLTSQVARYVMVRVLCAGPPLRRRYVDRSLLKPLMSMSGWIALTDFAEVVIGGIDPIVVGLIAGVPQAGVYAVGSKLAALTNRFTSPLMMLFFPYASELSASGRRESIRATLITGTRIAVAVATPLTIVLGVLARPAIRFWVGPHFSEAALVVVYLAVTALVYSVAQTGVLVLRGMGDVKFPARINLFEAVLNLSLSVVLCKAIGIAGVALGTLIAAVFTQLMVLLPYICRRTELKLVALIGLLARQFLLPGALSLGVGLFLLNSGLDSLGAVTLAGAAIMTTYVAVAFLTALSTAERRRLLDFLSRRRHQRLANKREESAALRIMLVDPSSRGGIVAYTRLIARALRLAGGSPEILGSVALDPAEADIRLERRLPTHRWGKPAPAGPKFYLRRILTWYRSARVITSYVRKRRPDIVHFQAPINRRFDAYLIKRLARHVPVVWTAHDVLPFERSEHDPDWFASIYRDVDRVVVHTTASANAVRSLAGVEPVVIAHPVPEDIVRTSRSEARRRLGLPQEGRIAAALGFIRPYKGYGLLADVWESLGKDAPMLLVLGELLAEEERPVIERLERTGRADIRLGYATESDLQLAVTASDVLLLPYIDASESGLLHLARALGVPVIASDAPELAEAVASSATGVSIPRTVDAWSTAARGKLAPPPPTPPDLESVGRAHLALYRDVLGRRRRGA